MKSLNFIVLTVLLFCFSGLNLYAQKKEITKEEFFDAYKKTAGKAATFRVVRRSETYRDGKLTTVSNYTDEYAAPDKRRSVSDTKIFETNQTFAFESVSIGSERYERKNGGEWTKQPLDAPVKSAVNKSKLVESNAKFYLTENAKFENQTANLYELSVDYEHANQNASSAALISHRKEKRWISREGFLLKMEIEDEFENTPKTSSRQTATYEYDPNIKIEAPVKDTFK